MAQLSVLMSLYINENTLFQTCASSDLGTHNRFRVFLASTKSKEEEMLLRMVDERGIALEDSEARIVCGDECKILFGTRDPRRLTPSERILLAQTLRRKYRLTRRQLALVVRLPEAEIRQYVP